MNTQDDEDDDDHDDDEKVQDDDEHDVDETAQEDDDEELTESDDDGDDFNQEESTTSNQKFLDSIDDGMKKIIKEQVKKEVSKIIPKVEKFVTDQLSLNLPTFSETALQGRLVKAYEADKILLDTYGDTVTIKRPRDGADDDQEPSAGTDRGSKRRRSGKEPASTSAPSETTTKTAGKTTSTGSKTHKKSASQSAPVGEAMQSTDVLERPADQEFETGCPKITSKEEINGISNGRRHMPKPNVSQTIVKYDKFALWGISHWGKKQRQFYAFATSKESARDVYSKRRIIDVTKVEIVEWQRL
ncbi:hypothetical protein Tco_0027401 [Tanacetum coccineum]